MTTKTSIRNLVNESIRIVKKLTQPQHNLELPKPHLNFNCSCVWHENYQINSYWPHITPHLDLIGGTLKQNTSQVAKGALTHRLQRHTTCKIQNGHQGVPKWPTGSGKVPTPRFLGVLSNFCWRSFLIRALLLWEKVATEEKTENKPGEKKEGGRKRMMKIVAPNVDASQPLERRPLVPISAS